MLISYESSKAIKLPQLNRDGRNSMMTNYPHNATTRKGLIPDFSNFCLSGKKIEPCGIVG